MKTFKIRWYIPNTEIEGTEKIEAETKLVKKRKKAEIFTVEEI